MNRRQFLAGMSGMLAGAAGTGALLSSSAAAAGEQPLNFVFLLIDDLGWTDLGCYGSRFYDTPNVDRLARLGMRFTNGYAACTVCSPTRASIMTGKYPARLHLTDWIAGHVLPRAKLKIPDWTKLMRHEEVTLPEALKPLGYRTGFIGKWHLGPEGYWPDSQGFDVNIGGYSRGSPPSYFAPYRIPTMKEGPKGEYLTDRHADDAVAFLEQNREKPFFLYLSMYAVHTPLQAKEELIAKYKARAATNPDYPQNNPVYGGMVDSMDQCVGRVLDALDRLGLMGRTAVFFTGDNGGLIGNPKRPVTSNRPLRAGKGSSYEGGVREPVIVYWPGVTKPGSTCDEPVISNDFYPTILEMAGTRGDPDHNRHVDGVSLVPLFKQTGGLHRDALYWHYPHYHPGGATPYGAIRQGDYKLIEFYEDQHVELYNLRDDIGESRDLAGKEPERAAALRAKLHAWRQRVDAQMPTPNPAYDSAHSDTRQPRQRTRKTGTYPGFAIVRDAEISPADGGFLVAATKEGTALIKAPKPYRKRAVFEFTMQTRLTREEGWQNGFLAFSDSGKDRDLTVAGVYIGGQRLRIFDGFSDSPDGGATESATFDRQSVIPVRVVVDLERQRVEQQVAGKTVGARLRKDFGPLRYYGYHVMQTRTVFGKIRVSGE